jgi:protein transport protein SEC61 subunit gamma-like protein
MEESLKPQWTQKIKHFLEECKRILIITKKPSKEEFKTIFKVSGIGVIVIGFVGFILQMIKQLLLK